MVAYAVFLCVGEIGMRGTEHVFHVVVISRMLVGVPYHEPNGASRRHSLVDARKELYGIGFLTSRSQGRLPRAAACKFLSYEFLIDADAGRESVNHASNRFSVRFAEAGQRKYISKSVVHTYMSFFHHRLHGF